jgi:methyl acetate hydrolase
VTPRAPARLRTGLVESADAVLRRTVERPHGVPGVVAMATDRYATVYEGAAGWRELGAEQPMTTDTVMYIYSCTKAVTAAAVMQLVESGLLTLEDSAKTYLPELAQIQVLEGFDARGEPQLRAPKTDISVGQLLVHTAGFGYEFFNHELLRYARARQATSAERGTPAPIEPILLFDPGTRWEYGTGLDWAGRIVERVRGDQLGEVLRKHIFEPLDMHDTGFRLSPSMRRRRATIHQRESDGRLNPKPEIGEPAEPQADVGGTGLIATVGDYMKFIRMILCDGETRGEARVLTAESVARMAQNGLGSLKVRPMPGTIPRLSHDAEFFPGLPKSWGLGWMINDEPAPTGRPAGQLGWAGLANLYYWIDRRNGIGGLWATQILPFFDSVSLPGALEFETAVYDHLDASP